MRLAVAVLLLITTATLAACGGERAVRNARRDFIAAVEKGPEATRAALDTTANAAPLVYFIDEVYFYDRDTGGGPVACYMRTARFRGDTRFWHHALALHTYADLFTAQAGLDTDTFFDAHGQRRSPLDRHVIYSTPHTREQAERLAERWTDYDPELRDLPPGRADPKTCGAAWNT